MLIRYCACGRLLTSMDIQEGRPCRVCVKNKKLKISPLFKMVRKPNPAPNLYIQKEERC